MERSRAKLSQNIPKMQKNFMWTDDKSAFKRQAFVAATKAVSDQFGEVCHWTKVENRLKTLKKQWATIMNLKNLSGSNFDPSTKTITMGTGSYQDYVKAHPKEAVYLNVPIAFYDELAIICGDDQATGEFAMDDLNETTLDDVCGVDENDNDNDLDDNDEEVTEESPRGSNMQHDSRRVQHRQQQETTPESVASGSRVQRRKRKGDTTLQSFVEKLDQIADNMIDPVTRRKNELKKALNVFKSEMEEDTILQAYSWLIKPENENEADVFLARSQESRKDWLCNFMLQ